MTALNVLGGDEITLEGTNLPANIENSEISLVFGDGQETKCKPVMSTSTKLVCVTEPFDAGTALGQAYKLAVSINGETITFASDFQMKSTNVPSLKMDPLSVNPVLKRVIEITLDAAFPHTL